MERLYNRGATSGARRSKLYARVIIASGMDVILTPRSSATGYKASVADRSRISCRGEFLCDSAMWSAVCLRFVIFSFELEGLV